MWGSFVTPNTNAEISESLLMWVDCTDHFSWIVSLNLSSTHVGEGDGTPLQCSCLGNPRDGGAWWAAVCGVARSRTRLKRLSSSSTRSSAHALSGRWVSSLTTTGKCRCSSYIYFSICFFGKHVRNSWNIVSVDQRKPTMRKALSAF